MPFKPTQDSRWCKRTEPLTVPRAVLGSKSTGTEQVKVDNWTYSGMMIVTVLPIRNPHKNYNSNRINVKYPFKIKKKLFNMSSICSSHWKKHYSNTLHCLSLSSLNDSQRPVGKVIETVCADGWTFNNAACLWSEKWCAAWWCVQTILVRLTGLSWVTLYVKAHWQLSVCSTVTRDVE